MTTPVTEVLIVGGGTAGWLTAGVIAATHAGKDAFNHRLQVRVIESDGIAPIGVGEGTWPSMRSTLMRIGISEAELVREASATFKQASKFVDWHRHGTHNSYYHPFSAPQGSAQLDITPYWLMQENAPQYAHAVCFQPALCEAGLAPRSLPGVKPALAVNYGYHLDAGKFIALLKRHCVEKLGVIHIQDRVTEVVTDKHEGIQALVTEHHGTLSAQLYIDCTGFHARLIEKALGVPLKDYSNILLADTALVTQQPYDNAHQSVSCVTQSSAQEAGWIWDIGLQSRRGVGYVYSSQFHDDNTAEQHLRAYLARTGKTSPEQLRTIRFKTGHRQRFWQQNCVAIGLSSGFLEPLEASSLMLIEQSALLLAEQLPTVTDVFAQAATRFNRVLSDKWSATIEFLKLHYVLSNRTEPFWQVNRHTDSQLPSLVDKLEEWRYRPIQSHDVLPGADLFSAQSFRYIYYGMQAKTDMRYWQRQLQHPDFAQQQLHLNQSVIAQYQRQLPSHRAYLDAILAQSHSTIGQ